MLCSCLPALESAPLVTVELDGEVRKVQTYGQLVTSIINPSHTLVENYPRELLGPRGESPMTNYNEVE